MPKTKPGSPRPDGEGIELPVLNTNCACGCTAGGCGCGCGSATPPARDEPALRSLRLGDLEGFLLRRDR